MSVTVINKMIIAESIWQTLKHIFAFLFFFDLVIWCIVVQRLLYSPQHPFYLKWPGERNTYMKTITVIDNKLIFLFKMNTTES